jgi:NAD(P)-dependent dehydrogenase (short-subunit alcohol dehydrogenase family)
MTENQVVLVTGARKGIGRALVEHYAGRGCHVIACSRGPFEGELSNYRHYCLDISDEPAVREMFEIVCAAVRLRQPRDARQFHHDLRQFCRGRLQEFQIPMQIKLVENVMHGERFENNRREYVAR